jgi:hypothetical protein
MHWVTGEFTIHGVSRVVTFPARIAVTVKTATLDGTFTISQTAFGMAAAERTKCLCLFRSGLPDSDLVLTGDTWNRRMCIWRDAMKSAAPQADKQ